MKYKNIEFEYIPLSFEANNLNGFKSEIDFYVSKGYKGIYCEYVFNNNVVSISKLIFTSQYLESGQLIDILGLINKELNS